MTEREIEERIHDILDGNANETEKREFFELAQSDPKVMRAYCLAASMDASLQRFAHGQISFRNSSDGNSRIVGESRNKRVFQWAFLSAVALLLIGALALRLISIPEPVNRMSYQLAAGSVLEVSHKAGSNGPPGEKEYGVGSRFNLGIGTIKFELEKGVTMVASGPADITFVEEGVVYLEHGTAWFHVPEGAEGFRARTKHTEVVDLGTEFGIISRKNRLDEIHLIDGEIEVRSLHALRQRERLVGQGGRQVGAAGRLKEIEFREEVFARDLPVVHRLPLRWSLVGNVDQQASEIGDPTAPILSAAKSSGSEMGLNGTFSSVSLSNPGDQMILKGVVIFTGGQLEARSASLNFGLLERDDEGLLPVWNGYRMTCAGRDHQSHLRWLSEERNRSPANGVGNLLWKSESIEFSLEEEVGYQFFLSVTKEKSGQLIESSLRNGEEEFAKAEFLHESEGTRTFNSVALLANRSMSPSKMSLQEVEVVFIPAGLKRGRPFAK